MVDPVGPITDERELRNFLAIPESRVPTPDLPPDPLLPRAKRAVESVTGPLSVEAFIQKEQRPGIPLQVEPGESEIGTFSPWLRFQTERRQTLEDQRKYLETQFPGKVRKATTSDDFIIEVKDPATGKPKDVLLNEAQITLSDLGALAADSPEVALSILAAGMGGPIAGAARGPAVLKALMKFAGTGPGRLALGATAFKAGEAAEQVETELEQGQSPAVPLILGQKARQIPAQMTLDALTAGVFKTFSTLNRLRKGGPGMFQTSVEKEGLAGEARLRGKYGQGLSYSGGEASGMPLLSYLEAYASAKPQASAIVQEFRDLQMSEVKALREAMTSQTGTDEEAGQKLLDFLNTNRAAKKAALDKIQATMTAKESQGLLQQLGKVSDVKIPFFPSAEGAALRERVQASYGDVKKRVGTAYEEAYAVPGAQVPSIPTKPLADAIDAIAGTFAQYNKVEGVQWLNAYKRGLEDKETYRDIVNRRSDLWNKIETSPADRSTKDYLHGELSRVMTETLDDATKNIMNPAFRAKIQAANEIYKKSELPFYQVGLRDVLLKEGERGAPENLELLRRFENTDLYRRLANVAGTGPQSPIEIVKSSVIDGLLTKSGTAAIDPKNIDAARLGKNLAEFASNRNTREMFNDIFGKSAKNIREQAQILEGIQGTIPREEAESFLAAGIGKAASRRNLEKVVAAQQQLDRVEAKRLLKSPSEFVNPEDLASRYLDHLTLSELKSLTTRLETEAPAVHRQLQDKLVEQILGKAGTYKNVTSSSVEKVLFDPAHEAKYRAVLGSKFQDIEDFGKALGPRDRAREIAKATGLLIKGESIGELAKPFELGKKGRPPLPVRVLGIVPGWLGWKMTARFITSGGFREWAAQGYPKGWEKNIMAGIMTEPFLEDIATSSASPEIVRNVAMAAKQWANRVSQPTPEKPPESAIQDAAELKKFLNE